MEILAAFMIPVVLAAVPAAFASRRRRSVPVWFLLTWGLMSLFGLFPGPLLAIALLWALPRGDDPYAPTTSQIWAPLQRTALTLGLIGLAVQLYFVTLVG